MSVTEVEEIAMISNEAGLGEPNPWLRPEKNSLLQTCLMLALVLC